MDEIMATNIFSAEEPTLGYLYQINYSLLLLIQSSEIENAKIGIEKLDDIQIEAPDFTKLYQTKYHLNSVANLSDRSVDFWKTIRIWSAGINDGSVDIEETVFHLITTANISSQGIISELRKVPKDRDIDKIVNSLKAIAGETTNKDNKEAYAAFNALTEDHKKKLVFRIMLIDSAIDITDVKKKIYSELRKTIIDTKVPALYERLIGWYLEQIIKNLLGQIQYVSFKAYQNKCFDIVDTLKIDNLPVDFPNPIEFSETDIAELKQRNFVKQLHIIGIKDNTIKSAISDYHRAYEQRSRWVRESLINPEDEITYESKLVDDWQRKFSLVTDDSSDGGEDEKAAIGKAFYTSHYISSYPRIFIRERFEHAYMVTGSCHILSDSKKIGWHPLFKEKV